MHPLLGRNSVAVKEIKRLMRRRHRDLDKKFIIEGVRFVEEALFSNWVLEMLIYSSGLTETRRGRLLLEQAGIQGVKIARAEAPLLRELSDTDNPQGVLALMRRPSYDLNDILPGCRSPVLLVDGVQDPGNLGTIIRTADAAGAGGVFLLKGTVDLYNPKTLRSTMGSLFHLPVLTDCSPDDLLGRLSMAGWQVVVGDPAAELFIHNVDLKGPTALVVGSEARGPSEYLLGRADYITCIPMPGRAESLNAGVAASIMLYEVTRQKLQNVR